MATSPDDQHSSHVNQEVLKDVSVKGNLTIGNVHQTVNNYPASDGLEENSERRTAILEMSMRRSRARCIARWQGAGISESIAVSLADDPSVGSPPSNIKIVPNSLIILTGEMGAGKSLALERLFQLAVRQAIEDAEAPTPIFLQAAQLQKDQALESIVLEACRQFSKLSVENTLVFVDGVDEAGASTAVWLLGESRLLAKMESQIAILLASRPIPDFITAKERIEIPLLSDRSAESMVARLARRQRLNLSNSLPKSVYDAIHRPLFAIFLGSYLQENNAQFPRSKEQLLAFLVRKSLRPFEQTIVQTEKTLKKLAVASIDRGGLSVPINEVFDWSEQTLVANSRLIVIEDSDKVRFSLPILTEWFAAHSLLDSSELDIDALLADSQRLERWQYPFVLGTAILPPDKASEILTPMVEKHPAIASAIINEALANQGYAAAIPSLSAFALGRQVKNAMQSWIAGLGELASLIAPLLPDGSSPALYIRVGKKDFKDLYKDTGREVSADILEQPWIEIGWSSRDDESEGVVELPPGTADTSMAELRLSRLYGSMVYSHPSWAWLWSHEKLVDSLSEILQNRALPVESGCLSLEAAWYGVSKLLAGSISYWHPIPFSQSVLLSSMEPLLTDASGSSFSASMRHALSQLRIEISNAQQQGHPCLNFPPAITNFYSSNTYYAPDILLAYAETIHKEALTGYEYLVRRWFPYFSNQLSLFSILPARLVGAVIPPTSSSSAVSLSTYWEALPVGASSSVDFSLSDRPLSADDERYRTATNELRTLRPKSLLYPSIRTYSWTPLTDKWLGACPVTKLVYQWLWDDLSKMGWVKDELSDAGYPHWR